MDLAERGGSRTGAGRPAGLPTRVVRLPLPLATAAQRIAAVGYGSDLGGAWSVEARTAVEIPLMVSKAACGFPSPADDYLDKPLDFNELLIKNPPATFAVRVEGMSMRDAGILPGDIAIIDRAVTPVSGCIVMAIVSGEFTIKRYLKRGERVVLHPENSDFPDLIVADGMDFEVWGVLTGMARTF